MKLKAWADIHGKHNFETMIHEAMMHAASEDEYEWLHVIQKGYFMQGVNLEIKQSEIDKIYIISGLDNLGP